MKPAIIGVLASLSLVVALGACEPSSNNDPANWSEADKAKAAARERRKAHYSGGRHGAR